MILEVEESLKKWKIEDVEEFWFLKTHELRMMIILGFGCVGPLKKHFQYVVLQRTFCFTDIVSNTSQRAVSSRLAIN